MARNTLDETVLAVSGLEINKCLIVSADGSLDFKNLVLEINYFEDIFTSMVSGNIILNDSAGHHNLLSWCGDEFLLLEVDKPKNASPEKALKGIFRIYSTEVRHLTSRGFNENFVLNFCSEEAFLSDRIRISKSYKQMKISAIVKDIAINYLKIPKKKFPDDNIEETFDKYDLVIPNLKPLEAISWLCTMAISDTVGKKGENGSHGGLEGGATYLFYRNRDGWHFRSLLSIFNNIKKFEYRSPFTKDKNSSGYWYGNKNIDIPDELKFDCDPYEQILSYEIMNNFDAMERNHRGMFSNKLVAVDYLTRDYEEKIFDYDKYFQDHLKPKVELYKIYNKHPILSNAEDRFRKKHNQYQPVIKVAPSTTRHKQFGESANYVENTMPYRFAQLALINYNRVKLLIPGDPYITIGKIIYIHTPQATQFQKVRPQDRFIKGRYLVSAVRQIMDSTNFQTVLECVKDSYADEADAAANETRKGLSPFNNGDRVLVQIRADTYDWTKED